jgi:two-component system, OmpR family, sensor histidine kinase KdpD
MARLREAAHEIRRPLGVALGYVAMLLEGQLGALPDAQRQALLQVQAKLKDAHHQLEQQVLLDRLETDAVMPEMRRVDLVSEVQAAIGRSQASAELARATLTSNQPTRAIHALADSALLERVLDNVLDNALASATGTPQVEVETGVDDRPFVRVCDGGKGISPELREQVFARGFRADRSRSGSGLGLYLSRQAAEQMGATLWLEWTQPGQGSCFRLDLRPAPDGSQGCEP